MKNTTKSVLGLAAVVTTLTALPSAAATIRCVNPAGTGGCFDAIQLAVDASNPGDLVKVAPGIYYENVVVPAGKDGLRIVGTSRVTTILDPDTYTDLAVLNTGPGIQILSRNVQVRSLAIRNGQADGIVAAADGVILQGLRLTGMRGAGIVVTGWFGQVVGNDISHAGSGVLSFGFQSVVRSNTVANCNAFAFFLGEDGAQVIGNRVLNTPNGVYAAADGALLRSNDVRYSGNGIDSEGRSPTLTSNRILGATSVGILARCTDCFGGALTRNSVTDTGGYGVQVFADNPGFVVQANSLLRAGAGFYLDGPGIVADRNRAREVGFSTTASCFEVYGQRSILTRNSATQCARAGFYVAATVGQVTLDRNVATATLENGFTVDAAADAILMHNRAISNAGQGFAVLTGASNTVLTSNFGSQNRTDFCDQGTATVDSGNSFTTTSATCDISH
jgi:hypothetical protein